MTKSLEKQNSTHKIRAGIKFQLEDGAKKGLSTSMALNRNLNKGVLGDWLPLSEQQQKFFTDFCLVFPNGNIQLQIQKLLLGTITADKLDLKFLDPTGVFQSQWPEITANIEELFLDEEDSLTGELAFQQFYSVYTKNAQRIPVLKNLQEFTIACVSSYSAMLHGVYSYSIMNKFSEELSDGECDLIRYYEELMKKLLKQSTDQLESKIRDLFLVKPIERVEKNKIMEVFSRFLSTEQPTSNLKNMMGDIVDFYESSKTDGVSSMDRITLYKMLSENYKGDETCRALLQEMRFALKSEPIPKPTSTPIWKSLIQTTSEFLKDPLKTLSTPEKTSTSFRI